MNEGRNTRFSARPCNDSISNTTPGPRRSSRVDPTTPLVVMRLNNGRLLLGRLKVNIAPKGAKPKAWLTVPKGFDTGYSSLSWFGRPVVHWSKLDVACMVHDYLYIRNGASAAKKLGFTSRLSVDNVWYRIGIAGQHGARPWPARICWFFTRVFGRCAYRKRQGTPLSLDECGCTCCSKAPRRGRDTNHVTGAEGSPSPAHEPERHGVDT